MTRFGTAHQLGYNSDLEVISAIKNGKENVLLLPQNQMRPDCLWLTYQNKKWYAVVIAQKIYTTPINSTLVQSAIRSTDLKLVYYTATGEDVLKQMESISERFHKLTDEAFRNNPKNLGGMLRVHIFLPTKTNDTGEGITIEKNQICLFITKANVTSLFPESNVCQVLCQATETDLLEKISNI